MSLFNFYKTQKEGKFSGVLQKTMQNNFFKDSRNSESKSGALNKEADDKLTQKLPNMVSMQSQAAMRRVENWAGDFLDNEPLQKALDAGSIPLLHLNHHNYRPRNTKSAIPTKKQFFPCKKYFSSPSAQCLESFIGYFSAF